MHTLFDFITHVKVVEYLIAVSSIAGFILFWEILKPKPFKKVMETGREDLAFMKESGKENIYKTIGKIATAPFVGLAYIIALPVVFAYAMFSAATGGVLAMAGKEAAFGWRPAESYLAGRKKKEEDKKKDEKE